MSSEQDKDLVAKKNACCMQSTQRGVAIIFPLDRERFSEDPAPLAQYTQRCSLSPKSPFGNLLIPESVE